MTFLNPPSAPLFQRGERGDFCRFLARKSHVGENGGEPGPLLPTFTFAILFLAKKRACGPEARALRGKSIGGKRNPIEDPTVLPQNKAGPSGAPPGAPTSESPCSRGKEGLPARSKKRCMPHGFSAQWPCFRARQCLRFNRSYAYLAKSEGGQAALSIDRRSPNIVCR
jgi:hypothetical protein